MNVVDSSAWLDYLADGPNATFFAEAVECPDSLVVPSITLFEVFKRVLNQRDESDALQAIALMMQGVVAPLDSGLAIEAARLSTELKLPLADSIILATARAYSAVLWTQDTDFDGLEGVRYRSGKS